MGLLFLPLAGGFIYGAAVFSLGLIIVWLFSGVKNITTYVNWLLFVVTILLTGNIVISAETLEYWLLFGLTFFLRLYL